MLNLKRLETKLKAIQDKDLDEIIEKNTYIPSLGRDYTKKELKDWLDIRANFLISMRGKGKTKSQVYSKLSAKQKGLSDKIMANEKVELSEEDNEKLVEVKLYKFLTEDNGLYSR